MFGSPWSFGRFSDPFHKTMARRGSFDEDDFGYGGYSRSVPCPRYQSMRTSNWEVSPGRGFVLRSELPGVQPEHRRVWLSEDGSAVHLRALRPIPRYGRACLPHGAQISANGRYEVLEKTILLPHNSDATGATLRETSDGLHIFVPHRTVRVIQDSQPPVQNLERSRKSNPAHLKTSKTARAPSQHTDEHPANVAAQTKAQLPQAFDMPAPALPEGIEVVDVDLPEPEKEPNASEGYWDRSEFHHY